MAFKVVAEHPPLRVEPNGTVRVGQTRVTLDTLFSAYQNGATAEQIVAQYPTYRLPRSMRRSVIASNTPTT